MNKILNGDCLDALHEVASGSISLIVTSPPYAEKRTKTYGGIPASKYVDWFLPRSEQFLRVLSPTGSFVLIIKEGAENGERQTYVMELVLALKKQGWLWTEEYIWHKSTCFPGKWPNRFRDAWEHCYHFTKQKSFYMDQNAVMVPIGAWSIPRLKNLSKKDKTRDDSGTQSGFAKKVANWKNRSMVYPANVLHLSTEASNKDHSAAFPIALPTWFIKLFSKPGDLVLDPIVGSGSTGVAAKRLKRQFLGIDISHEYCKLARKRVEEEK